MQEVAIVIPCYNEARRLVPDVLVGLARSPGVRLLLVDDGSTDGTLPVLERIRDLAPDDVKLLSLAANSGKGEAVRRGLLDVLAIGCDFVGYLDADLATPVSEMERIVEKARSGDALVVMGSRVALSGRVIDRKVTRHLLGRVFATAASFILHAQIYDTQCGAKVFRNTPLLGACLAEPFDSRWLFDLELLGRLIAGTPEHGIVELHRIVEVPLRQWADVPGSKLGARQMVGAGVDLLRVGRAIRRWK